MRCWPNRTSVCHHAEYKNSNDHYRNWYFRTFRIHSMLSSENKKNQVASVELYSWWAYQQKSLRRLIIIIIRSWRPICFIVRYLLYLFQNKVNIAKFYWIINNFIKDSYRVGQVTQLFVIRYKLHDTLKLCI